MQTSITSISTDDGRVLHVAETGHPDGIPVVIHGGTPGSHVFFKPWVHDAEAHGLRLISYDRPGYAESTPLPNRTVASAAGDVAAIAKHLNLKLLATVGPSGGGPHALACAALLPDLVVAAVAMASFAPFTANGLDWFAGMDEGNIKEFVVAVEGHEALTGFIAAAAHGLADTTADEMVTFFQSMSTSAANAAAVEQAARWVFDAIKVGLEHGNSGWIDDDLAFCAPWGFDLTRIRVPVLLMHGVQDTLVPIAHGRWLAGHIPDVDERYFDNYDHMTLFAREFPMARAWLVSRMR